jgi:hypothetical protein
MISITRSMSCGPYPRRYNKSQTVYVKDMRVSMRVIGGKCVKDCRLCARHLVTTGSSANKRCTRWGN